MSDLPTLTLDTGRAHPERPRLTVRLSFPYDEYFIQQLKDEVPKGERAFDAKAKCWWCSPDWQTKVEDLMHARWHAYRVEGEGASYVVDADGEMVDDIQPRLI